MQEPSIYGVAALAGGTRTISRTRHCNETEGLLTVLGVDRRPSVITLAAAVAPRMTFRRLMRFILECPHRNNDAALGDEYRQRTG